MAKRKPNIVDILIIVVIVALAALAVFKFGVVNKNEATGVGDAAETRTITAFIDEDTAAKLYEGMPLSFNVSGSYLTYLGYISEIKDAFVETAAGNILIPIEIHTDDTKGIRLGAEAEIEIILQKKTDVILIPISALGKGKTVFIINTDGVIEERKIKTGVSNGNLIEVTSGLFEGEKLITDLTEEIKAGISAREKREDEQNH